MLSFEKENQKTFDFIGQVAKEARDSVYKVSCFCFEKETLTLLPAAEFVGV